MAIQTPNICKWTCNENIDKELSNDFWNNPITMDKQKSCLIKFRIGTYMGQAKKQTFFSRQRFPTITCPICNSYEPDTWLQVDNTFEYEGGLGRVTEEGFYATLKGRLKIKRYQLKKALQACKTKPKYIRQDHWIKLFRLISEDRKMKEAERLKSNRAQVKRPLLVGRNEEDLTTNLVTFEL